MKPFLPALVCLLVLFLAAIPAQAENPTVIVADYTISPSVLQPGDVGTITAVIRSTASSATLSEKSGVQSGGEFSSTKSTDIGVNIESIRLDSKDVEIISGNYKRIGVIGPGQSIPITFLIRAPAQDGIYFPEIWIDVTGGQSVRQPVPVNVNTQIAILKKPALTAIKTVPDGVNPGDDLHAQVILQNDGLSRADQITVTVNSSSPSITQKTTSTYHIGSLLKGENTSLDMLFSTDKRTPIGLNRVYLTMTYANPDGTLATQTEVLAVHVKGRAKIGIASVSIDPVRIKKGDAVSLIIRLENTGTDNANSVKASIDLPMSGGKDAYVGTIEPDNDAPAVFSLQAGNPGTYPYTLSVRYEDDYGVQTSNETLQMTVNDGDSTGLIAAVVAGLILCAGGYWFFVLRNKGSSDA
ncbi:MAG TPA: S-layer protein [Methanoregulaceae archaeon]|nr:S-layer protein [Methanoregulaceae archaeon]HPD76764.1 S-layer protein [Methanoregulaceae archaeon]